MTDFSTAGYLDMELLRFTTAGSVDDGKSTLIGRLLYDSKSIFEDQMEAIERSSELKGEEHTNLALLTDGLRAEREQGITIDVAYRYFATPKRKFIIADTPGHIQYTRNMVTGASTANLAIILIDARKGVIEQTYRHTYIAHLLKIPHIVVCINKMDLVDYDQAVFEKIQADYTAIAEKLDLGSVEYLPISALVGDNVVNRSEATSWYTGKTLLEVLESTPINNDRDFENPRFPVQYVIRPQSTEYHDFRGFAGQVAGGVFKVGDEIMVLPTGKTSKIKTISTYDGDIQEAFPPMSVTFTLEDEIDVSRGNMIVKTDNQADNKKELDVMMCWMSETPLKPRGKYILRHTSNEVRCIVNGVINKVDIEKIENIEDNSPLQLNEIGKVSLKTAMPVFTDDYRVNRISGSIILVDEATNETVAAGMIR
jgi:sulfate adenylyltransferase subunit 1